MTLQDGFNAFLAKQAMMALLKKIQHSGVSQMLSGYKTYVIAAIMLILAVAKVLGYEVPGVTDTTDPGALVSMAIGLVFARGGAKSDVKKALGE